MPEQTPAQKLADIRKTLAKARRDEQKAVLELPREEWNRDYQWRKGRTLSGSKTVDVDFEIEKEDLEALGYHHQDDCSVHSYDDDGDVILETASHEDDRRALLDWHDEAHGLSLWAHCMQLPCKILTDEFRSTP